MELAQGTHIGTLRVRSPEEHGPAVRLQVARLLENAELRPSGVPPSSVLVVRHVMDPLPGRLAPRRSSLRPDAAWERAVRSVLTDHARMAMRPEQGRIHSSADAVLFADESELLACLALDLSRGEASGRWWWKAVLRAVPVASDGLAVFLCGYVRFLPAVLHHVYEWGHAPAMAAALSPQEADRVLTALLREFDLPDFRAGAFPADHGPIRHDDGTRTDPVIEQHVTAQGPARDEQPGRSLRSFPGPPPPPPWDRTVHSIRVPQGTPKERAGLLGLGLMIYHELRTILTRAFQRQLRSWWSAASHAETTGWDASALHTGTGDSAPSPTRKHLSGEEVLPLPDHRAEYPVQPHAREARIERETGEALATPASLPEEQPDPEQREREPQQEREVGREPAAAPGKQKKERAADETIDGTGPFVQQEYPEDAPVAERGGGPVPGVLDAPAMPEKAPTGEEPSAEKEHQRLLFSQVGAQTGLAGVLYLINLMKHLGLPGCFEDDWGLASGVGPWGVLEALGRGLLAGQGEELEHDPLWRALAALDSRGPGEMPGQRLRGNKEFRLPPGWIAAEDRDGEAPRYWAANEDSLRLWSSEGFLLVDCSRDRLPSEVQALRELRRSVPHGSSPQLRQRPFSVAPAEEPAGPMVAGMNGHLLQWLGMVLPHLRSLLRRSLRGPGNEDADVVRTLLVRPGRLFLTSSHLDLVMGLNDISLPARRAGLDRDPGWLPDWGRVVLFHFE